MIRKLLVAAVCLLFPAISATAATITHLDPIFGGRVSQGGIVQQNAFNAGYTSFYGDVFRLFAGFDLSGLPGARGPLQSAELIVTAATFWSAVDGRLLIGSISGNPNDFDKIALPGNALNPLDRSLFPRTMVTTYGEATLPGTTVGTPPSAGVTRLPTFSILLGDNALSDIIAAAADPSRTFGLAGMLDRSYRANEQHNLDAPLPFGLRLSLTFADAPVQDPLAPSVVPLPGSVLLLGCALAGLGGLSLRRRKAAHHS